MPQLPTFIIIGAMKCMTSSLHEQLALQPGIVMSDPKEPYFFSNDEWYARGIDWYTSLWAAAGERDLRGESSTHYTKLPTYPQTLDRMKAHLPSVKLIYVMRHPIDRLVSQYVHEWTQRIVTVPLSEALDSFPEMTSYSEYGLQLQPFFEAYGKENVLPVFFDALRAQPQVELDRIGRFIGAAQPLTWHEQDAQNVSSERMRVSPLRDAIVNAPLITAIRRNLIPQSLRDRIKKQWTMSERPELTADEVARLEAHFDPDLAQLGQWLGIDLNCANFKEQTRNGRLNWV